MVVPISSISPSSISCSTKVFVGLKPQNSSPFASAIPNLTAGFYERGSKSLLWRYGSKPPRGRVSMMAIATPIVYGKVPGQEYGQWTDLWNALYRERIVYLGQYIDEEFSNKILATLLYLDTVESSKKLYLYINGDGGDVTPTMALYDTALSLRSPVATHCIGYAYNLSGFLLASGDKGCRTAMPLSLIALQTPAGAARGLVDDVVNEANELNRIKDYLYKELATNTGQTVEKISEDLHARMKRFNAKEALEYGLIDRIVKPRKQTREPTKDQS